MKLNDILNEIQVSRPLSKQTAFEAIYNFNPWLCYPVYDSSTIDEFIEYYGHDNLSHLLEDEYSYQGDQLEEAIYMITNYYRVIKPGDVKIGGGQRMSVEGYKNVELIYPENDIENSFLVLTKF